jgi:cell wall assembly regulator SMI1
VLEEIRKLISTIAPQINTALQGPASKKSLEELKQLVGEKLPEGLIALYSEANGTAPDMFANFAYGIPFISIERAISQLEQFNSMSGDNELRYSDPGIKKSYTFSKKRIPIGDDNGTSLLCVDLDPDSNGIYGQVILIDYENDVAIKLSDSVEQHIEKFESDLKDGKYSLQEDALEDGVHWLSPAREIDPINWFNSPTWEYVNNS